MRTNFLKEFCIWLEEDNRELFEIERYVEDLLLEYKNELLNVVQKLNFELGQEEIFEKNYTEVIKEGYNKALLDIKDAIENIPSDFKERDELSERQAKDRLIKKQIQDAKIDKIFKI